MNDVTLSELVQMNPRRFQDSALYGDDFLVAYHVGEEVYRENVSPFLSPVRFQMSLLVLCVEGDLLLRCDMQHCHLSEGCLLLVKPGSVLQVEGGDMKCMSVFATGMSFEEKLSVSITRLIPHSSNLEKLTVIRMETRDFHRVDQMISHLMDSIRTDSAHPFYHEMVMSKVTALTYEFIHAFSFGLEQQERPVSPSSAQESVFRRYMELLGRNFRNERKVAFYASEMGLSPKHLSRQVSLYSGHSPSYWIDEYVLNEACSLLEDTDLTIQMVSDYLNFPDQSFFGKYFKKHKGVSPKAYRRMQTR